MSSTRVLKGVRTSNGVWIKCAWDDCENQGFELHKSIEHEHTGRSCDEPGAEHISYIYCSDKHKQYHRYSHINYGQLPPGYRN